MIFLIDKNKELKKIIEEVNFSNLGILERTHMEEWISKSPEILGEELLTITTEYDKFDKTNKRLDILAIDKKGKLVVIELKRDVAEAFVDLQAIHYAAYCSTLTLDQVSDIRSDYNNESKDKNQEEIIDFITEETFSDFDNQPRIIIVANDFKEETLAAVLWLRDSGIDITCVKLEAYELNEQIVITPDIIVPLPEAKNFMMYREQKSKTISPIEHTEMSKFWGELLNKVRMIKPEIPNRKPYKSTYFPIVTEYKNIHFEWMIRKRPERFMVCLHFEKPDKEYNLKLLNYFKSRKSEIEAGIPDEKITFDENWSNLWMQIYIQRDSADLDDKNLKWGTETMIKFYETLNPMLKEFFNNNQLN